MELLGRLGEAAHLVRRNWLEPLFARYGVQAGEFDVLATLRRSGAPYALTPTELFETTMISSGGMTSRLDRLERAGWVTRARNPKDRRGILVSLTEAGVSLMDGMIPVHVANEHEALKHLSVQEQQALNRMLEKLNAGL